MGLFGGRKGGANENERYSLLGCAKDEHYTLYELITRLDLSPERVRVTTDDLLDKGMIELLVIRPNRERVKLAGAQAAGVLARDASWQKFEPGRDKFLLIATDKGWRWHEKHWKPHN